jgi:hypothetical protein
VNREFQDNSTTNPREDKALHQHPYFALALNPHNAADPAPSMPLYHGRWHSTRTRSLDAQTIIQDRGTAPKDKALSKVSAQSEKSPSPVLETASVHGSTLTMQALRMPAAGAPLVDAQHMNHPSGTYKASPALIDPWMTSGSGVLEGSPDMSTKVMQPLLTGKIKPKCVQEFNPKRGQDYRLLLLPLLLLLLSNQNVGKSSIQNVGKIIDYSNSCSCSCSCSYSFYYHFYRLAQDNLGSLSQNSKHCRLAQTI